MPESSATIKPLLKTSCGQFYVPDGILIRRQHPIGNYIVDFYCHERSLAIAFGSEAAQARRELDGGHHLEDEQRKYDEERTKNLEHLGIKVLRFWNNEVCQNLEGVLDRVREEL